MFNTLHSPPRVLLAMTRRTMVLSAALAWLGCQPSEDTVGSAVERGTKQSIADIATADCRAILSLLTDLENQGKTPCDGCTSGHKHHRPGLKLQYCNFEGLPVACLNFTNANLTGARFAAELPDDRSVKSDAPPVTLTKINFTRTTLDGAILNFVNFEPARTQFTSASMIRVSLVGADLAYAVMTEANLTNANLTNANLANANLTNANLTDADLRGVALTRAILEGAKLIDADLTKATLGRANLMNAALTDTNLTDADLSLVNLTNANLRGADLTGAILRNATLTGADLTYTYLTGANLQGASGGESARWPSGFDWQSRVQRP